MIDWGVKLLSASLPSLHHWKKASFGDPPIPQIDQQEQYFISESTTCSQQQQSRNDPCTLRTLPIRCSVWCLPLSPSLHHFQVLSPFAREHAYVRIRNTTRFFFFFAFQLSTAPAIFVVIVNSPNHVYFFSNSVLNDFLDYSFLAQQARHTWYKTTNKSDNSTKSRPVQKSGVFTSI